MTKREVFTLLRRRHRISQRAAIVEARDRKNARMVDYHSGCMGVIACLEADVAEFGRQPRKRQTQRKGMR